MPWNVGTASSHDLPTLSGIISCIVCGERSKSSACDSERRLQWPGRLIAATPESLSYFVWQPPAKSISVRILPEVLLEIAAGRRPIRPKAAACSLARCGTPAPIRLQSNPIEGIEGRFWRGFSQSHDNSERRRLELALARWRPGADRPLAAVGYYRTEADGGALGPGNDDLMLIARYFSAPFNAFLFVRPAQDGTAAKGGLVCWQFGQIPETASDEFSLEAPPTALAIDQTVPPAPPEAALPKRVPGAPAVITVRRFWFVAAVIALLLLAAAAVGFFVTRWSPAQGAGAVCPGRRSAARADSGT